MLVLAILAAACLTASSAQALVTGTYHGGPVQANKSAPLAGPWSNHIVGNLAISNSAGTHSVCALSLNMENSWTYHEQCGVGGAGNALNVQNWWGDQVMVFVKNPNSYTTNILGRWYEDWSFRIAGEWVHSNTHMDSRNGAYRLSMQADGNLVIYKMLGGGGVCWASNTGGQHGAALAVQPDGNVVMYRNGTAVWATNTAGNHEAKLAMQPDGNLVLYSKWNTPIWSTNTSGC